MRVVADELDVANLQLRPLADDERDVDQFRTAGHRRDPVTHLRVGEPLLRHQLAQHALHAADRPIVAERIETQLDRSLTQLVVDVRALDDADALLVGVAIVDDLDALALLHVIRDDLPDRAIREGVVGHFDGEVVEEVGRPQPLEVRQHRLLGRRVVPDELVLTRLTRAQLDVIHVGLVLDRREPTLAVEARLKNPDKRRRTRRRQRERRRDRRSARCLGDRRLGVVRHLRGWSGGSWRRWQPELAAGALSGVAVSCANADRAATDSQNPEKQQRQ